MSLHDGAPRVHLEGVRFLGLGAAGLLLGLGGCGLTLDLAPQDDGGLRIGFDGRVQRMDGGASDAGPSPSDGGPPECTSDADCANDDVCDGVELCVEGRCVDGTPLDCEDAFDCTVDVCDRTQGCSRTPDHARCEDDGIACTTAECIPGRGCVAQPDHTQCADAVRCTSDVCDVEEGCRHIPMNALCAAGHTCDVTGDCDGLACETNADCADVPLGPCELGFTCEASRCVPTLRPAGADCEDGNPCTVASCTSDGACRGFERTECDGQPCWLCNPDGGGCDGSRLKSAGDSCEDGNLCTSGETCSADGGCAGTSGLVCPTVTCRSSICDPATGGCVTGNLPPGSECNDFNPCTATSACDGAGSCSVTTPFCTPSADECTNFTCTVVDGVPSCLSVTVACVGINRVCLAGDCVCRPGFQDCGDGGDCCDNAVGFCADVSSGSRTCTPYMDCRADCAVGQRCCPCTGLCCDAASTTCCAGCPAITPLPGAP